MVIAKFVDDEAFVTGVREAIKDNGGYCCCAIKKVPEAKCPCEEFRRMIKEGKVGETCGCGLYEIIEKSAGI